MINFNDSQKLIIDELKHKCNNLEEELQMPDNKSHPIGKYYDNPLHIPKRQSKPSYQMDMWHNYKRPTDKMNW